jgi:hypothetical protein
MKTLSYKAKKVLGFLVAKGLLISPNFTPCGTAKLTVDDFVETANEVEPRVLAVLPAAIIHFPRSFLDYRRLPKEVKDVIDAILAGNKTGPELLGIPYDEMNRWAHAKLKDARARPLNVRRIRKTYRFRPQIAARLRKLARKAKTTETAIIEKLVESGIAQQS